MRGLRATGPLTTVILLLVGRVEAQGQPGGPAQSSSQYTLNRGDPGGQEAVDARARMRAGDCAGALNGFDAAIEKTIEPTLRRDRGTCHEKLGNRQAAIEDYRAYLTAAPDAPDAAQIQQRLAALEGQKTPPSTSAEPKDTEPSSKPAKKSEKKETTSASSDDDDSEALPDGARIGLRTGYMIPLGESAENRSLNEAVTGGVPIWLDIGYHFAKGHAYVGAWGDFAFVFVKDKDNDCDKNGVSCSANQIRFGMMGAYHVLPRGPVDPWIGIGIGYEFLNLHVSQGNRSETLSISGFEFVNFQLGFDYLATPQARVGPAIGLSVGQYSTVSGDNTSDSIDNKSIHEWLTLGLRGAYDL